MYASVLFARPCISSRFDRAMKSTALVPALPEFTSSQLLPHQPFQTLFFPLFPSVSSLTEHLLPHAHRNWPSEPASNGHLYPPCAATCQQCTPRTQHTQHTQHAQHTMGFRSSTAASAALRPQPQRHGMHAGVSSDAGPMWRLLPARCRTAPPMTKLLLFLTYLVAAAAVRSRGPGWRDGGPTPSPDAVPVTQSSKADTRAHVAGMTMHVAASSWDSQVQQLPAARRSLLHAAGCHRPRCDLNRFGSHTRGRHVRPTDAAHAQRSWQDLCRPIVRPALIPLAPVMSK